jgi:hypothetical protein
MKISKETLQILKSFSAINANIMLREGNRLSTISPQKNVMVDVTVAETFPADFGIYDLSEFLGALSLFEDPEIEFKDKVAVLSSGSNSIRYFAAAPNVLVLPPEKKISFPSADVEFTLPAEVLVRAIRVASVLKSTDLCFVGEEGGELKIVVGDLKNVTANSFEVVIGKSNLSFKAVVKVDNLKMVQQEYKVSISSKKISRWVATSGDMTAFVALESNSSF